VISSSQSVQVIGLRFRSVFGGWRCDYVLPSTRILFVVGKEIFM